MHFGGNLERKGLINRMGFVGDYQFRQLIRSLPTYSRGTLHFRRLVADRLLSGSLQAPQADRVK